MSYLPRENSQYGTVEYWDQRYEQEDEFDWFKKFTDIADLLRAEISSREARICMLGCGNSTLSQDMYDDGYETIVNIDYSRVVIEKMRALHEQARPQMTWVEGDIKQLPLEDASFDVAIDKGTMDALMTTKGDVWDPPAEVVEACKAEVDEVVRILKPGGVFLYLTFGQPHFRKRHLERPGIWDLRYVEIGDAFHYYLYIAKKTSS